MELMDGKVTDLHPLSVFGLHTSPRLGTVPRPTFLSPFINPVTVDNLVFEQVVHTYYVCTLLI